MDEVEGDDVSGRTLRDASARGLSRINSSVGEQAEGAEPSRCPLRLVVEQAVEVAEPGGMYRKLEKGTDVQGAGV